MAVIAYQIAILIVLFVAASINRILLWIAAIGCVIFTLANVHAEWLITLQLFVTVSATIFFHRQSKKHSPSLQAVVAPTEQPILPIQQPANLTKKNEWGLFAIGGVVLFVGSLIVIGINGEKKLSPTLIPAPVHAPVPVQVQHQTTSHGTDAVSDRRPKKIITTKNLGKNSSDKRDCLSLKSNEAIAKCVGG